MTSLQCPDLPRSAARLSQTGPDAWERLPGGDLLVIVVMTAAIASVALADTPGPAGKAVAVGFLAACWLLAKVVGRRGIAGEQRGWVAAGYAVSLVSLFTTAAVIAPKSSFALFALGPYAFLALPTVWASVVVTLLSLGPALRFSWAGADVGTLLDFTVGAALVTTFSIVIGRWMCGVSQQSRERAELIRQLGATQARVEEMSVERGAMAERERLARDIHDTLAQGFASIIMLLEVAQSNGSVNPHVSRAVQTARENLEEARALVAELAPVSLANSLEDALRRLAASRREQIGIPVSFTASGPSVQLPVDLQVALFRAAQEGLSNVGKHAAASSAQVSLSYEDGGVRLEVRDDGCGFDPGTPFEGFGLRGMQARIEQIGGTLRIHRGRDAGTSIDIAVPTFAGPSYAGLESSRP